MAEKYDIIAATGCPTGIAHTFMAKEALEKAAAERGLTIKVETHGQVGIENALTPAEIAAARAVVVAADKDVNAERFPASPWFPSGILGAPFSQEAAGKLIDDALAAKADLMRSPPFRKRPHQRGEGELRPSALQAPYERRFPHAGVRRRRRRPYTAVSFLWGITSFDSTAFGLQHVRRHA